MAYAVVMAGGNGTRLWPEVRRNHPKHLLAHAGKTLLEGALQRADALVGQENVYITTNESTEEAFRGHIPPAFVRNVYTEPAVRDTGPAIGLMAARIAAWDPEAVIAFLPADHVIQDDAQFNLVLKAALKAGSTSENLVIIGIPPDEARTCYGYIRQGKMLYMEDGQPVYKVERFREKPNSQRAEKYVRQNGYLWNSGIVVGRANVILRLLIEHNPNLKPGLEQIMAGLGEPHEAEIIREAYIGLERIAFDYAVLEKTAGICVLQGNFGWEDIGSWSSVAKVSAKDGDGNVFAGAAIKAMKIDTTNCLVSTTDKLVATIGIDDLIVIDTDDVLFICKKERDQDVKALLKRLKEAGQESYL